MKHVTHWYGFPESDMASLGNRMESELALRLEPHESSYLGDYLLDRSGQFTECQLYFNRDPLWRADSDPEEEKYFEPDAADCDLLLTIDCSAGQIAEISRKILDRFPGARLVKSMGYDGD